MKARRPQDSADGDPEELKPPASTPAKAGYVGESNSSCWEAADVYLETQAVKDCLLLDQQTTASCPSGHISTYHKLAYGLPGVLLLPLDDLAWQDGQLRCAAA